MSLVAQLLAAGESLAAKRRERAAERAKADPPRYMLWDRVAGKWSRLLSREKPDGTREVIAVGGPMLASQRNTPEARAARKANKLEMPRPERTRAERKRRRRLAGEIDWDALAFFVLCGILGLGAMQCGARMEGMRHAEQMERIKRNCPEHAQ